jgi:hypothetical protein
MPLIDGESHRLGFRIDVSPPPPQQTDRERIPQKALIERQKDSLTRILFYTQRNFNNNSPFQF